MIFRILVILLIIVFYKPIFNFLKNNKIDNPENIKKTIIKNTKKFIDDIINKDFKDILKIIKKIDKKTYHKCIKILKNLKRIKIDIEQNRNIDFKNEFNNMKLQKKELLNLLASLVVNHGFFASHSKIIRITEKYLKDMLQEVLELAPTEYNINWFDTDIGEVEANDSFAPNFSYNYNIY
tara:strand:- start:811 stop:1350 length:540 start_codon:yes stop_codon:yes gene_type:complete